MNGHKRFKEIIIHIGIHKTGTTSIQLGFFKNRRLLESKLGILYPAISFNHGIPLYSMFCEQPESYHMNIRKGIAGSGSAARLNDKYFKVLKNNFMSTAADRLLLSGEDLSVLSPGGVFRLQQWLSSYTEKFRIIAWLRDPVSWASSQIQQTIQGGVSTLSQALKNPPIINYRDRMEKYINSFGREAVELVDFAEALKHQEGIIGRFCDHLNIEGNLRGVLTTAPKRNTAISCEAMLLISKINEKYPFFKDGKTSPGRWDGDIRPFTRIRGKKFRLDTTASKHVEEKTRAGLDWLHEKFGFWFYNDNDISEHKEEVLFSEEAITSLALTMFEEMRSLNAAPFQALFHQARRVCLKGYRRLLRLN